MVKGVTRRVIVIKAPDPKMFEEAIFIVRDDALSSGVTGDDILREARQVAGRYARSGDRRRRGSGLRGLWYAFCGAGMTGLAWLLTVIF